MRHAKPRDARDLLALRQAAARRGSGPAPCGTCRGGSTGNLPEVPETSASREQILRILRCGPDSADCGGSSQESGASCRSRAGEPGRRATQGCAGDARAAQPDSGGTSNRLRRGKGFLSAVGPTDAASGFGARSPETCSANSSSLGRSRYGWYGLVSRPPCSPNCGYYF